MGNGAGLVERARKIFRLGRADFRMKRAHRMIDLNCDMGELPEAIADGTQESLMPSLTSVNIACGGHPGGGRTMKKTDEQAPRRKPSSGAHPGHPHPRQ